MNSVKILKKNINIFKDCVNLEKEDIILAAFPKVGSSWLRLLFCNYLSMSELNGELIDWNKLDKIMPHFSKGELSKKWDYKVIPRIIKVHRDYFYFLFRERKAILQVRDPRDVMVSYFNFRKALKKGAYKHKLSDFIRDQHFGLPAFFRHFNSWKPHLNIIIKYETLLKNTNFEFTRLLKELNIPIKHDIIKDVCSRSSFKNMREIEKENGFTSKGKFKKEFYFMRRGMSNQYKNEFNKEDLNYYYKLKKLYNFNLY